MKDRFWVFGLAVCLLLLATSPSTVSAQYMYIDANGDGIHTAADVMPALGTPQTVAVWLDRNHNRDGSVTTCNTADGDLSFWNSYAVHINANFGMVNFSNFTNQVPSFFILCVSPGQDFVADSTSMAACRAGMTVLAPGPIRLFTMTVTPLTGTTSLEIVRENGLDAYFTSFGTPCSGNDFDNTYKLGSDWFDVDGLGNSCEFGCPPSLNPISNMTVQEGTSVSQDIHAADPDGDPLTFQKVSGPPYMTVSTVDAGAGLGRVLVSPGFADATSGVMATVRVTDGTSFTSRSFLIIVLNVDRPPVADAGGPYTGVAGVPIAFDGTGSSDPEGATLRYTWNFGDMNTATGPTPVHTYGAAGTYPVMLVVSDGSLSDDANTTATITTVFQGRAFTTKANRVIKLSSGKSRWTIQIEPIGQSFNIGTVGLGTIRMKSTGTGSVSEIGVVLDKTSLQGDADGNGVPDISATFSKDDLRALFSNLNGSTTVTATFEGQITSGGFFRAVADIGVNASGGPNAVSVVPNPLNPSGEVSFAVTKPGRMRVELFDVSGRLVRVLADRHAEAGAQSCAIDGRNGQGAPLASGIYYVRVSTAQETLMQRVAVLK
jgi:PKD repeat protein